MERLSGLDSAFLSLETPSMHLHVAIAAVLDPSTMSQPYSFDELKAFIAAPVDARPAPSGAASSRCRSASTTRSGSRTRTSTSTYHIRRHVLPSPGGPAS